MLVKVAALGALGFFGLAQRRFLIGKMQLAGNGGKRYFWWLVVAELGFMGLASGVATALARTATPVPQVKITATPAFILTGEALPPELTLSRYFTEWRFDLLWVLVIAFLAFFYLAGVWRLRRRGDRWPVHRTILWLAGLALLFYSTNGGVNVYEKYLFSVHMFMHMMLTMMVPVLLVPGSAGHARAAGGPQAAGRQPRGTGVDPVGRALQGGRGAHQPGGRRGHFRRVAVGVLLLAVVPMGDDRPHRPRVHGRALPACRLPVRDGRSSGSTPCRSGRRTRCGSSCCWARWPSTPSSA